MEIALNYSFIAWTALLALLAKRNANLSSLLLLMMFPKILDLIILTPSLQYIKSSDYRYLFFVVHSLNDVLMIALIYWRCFVSTVVFKQSLFRRLTVEKYIISFFVLSIITNLLVIGDYFKFWEYTLDLEGHVFYDFYPMAKRILALLEAVILTVLTAQTLKAVRDLKKRGLIK